MNRTCAICGCPIDDLHAHALICGKPQCVRERNRLKARKHGEAHLWGRTKVCVVCRKKFKTSRERYTICSDECRRKRRLVRHENS